MTPGSSCGGPPKTSSWSGTGNTGGPTTWPGRWPACNPSLFIGPNYSHFLDVPRSDLLYNRKRQLLCLAELSQAGVSVAPNLSAVMPADWDFWSAYLRDNPQLHHVAVNFQTGYRSRKEGLKAIDRVRRMQDEIGRGLSLLLVGGAQYVQDVAGRFASFTLIDSQPFKQSVYRKLFRPDQSRRSLGRHVDDEGPAHRRDHAAERRGLRLVGRGPRDRGKLTPRSPG